MSGAEVTGLLSYTARGHARTQCTSPAPSPPSTHDTLEAEGFLYKLFWNDLRLGEKLQAVQSPVCPAHVPLPVLVAHLSQLRAQHRTLPSAEPQTWF